MVRGINTIVVLALSAILLAVTVHAAERGMSVRVRVSEEPNAPVEETVSLYQGSYALVIGVGTYRPPWPAHPTAIPAARQVAAELDQHGFEVTLMTDPTAAELKQTLESFFIIKGEDPDSRLFIWFGGHGYNIGEEGFLVPIDAPDAQAGPRFKLSALAMRRFGEYVRLARSKHVMAVFDAHFETNIFDSRRAAPPPAITRATAQPARQFLVAGVKGQTSLDDGWFVEMFVDGLKGKGTADANRDGYVTASELGLFVSNGVTNASAGEMTPRFGSLRDPDYDRGDFVFTATEVAAIAPPPAPVAAPESDSATSVMIEFWRSIKDGQNLSDYKLFVESFPSSPFAALARNRIAELEGGTTSATAKPPALPASAEPLEPRQEVAMAAPPRPDPQPAPSPRIEPAPAPQAAQTPARPQIERPERVRPRVGLGSRYVVSAQSLVLSTPDDSARILGKIVPHTEINVQGTSRDGLWYKVALKNGEIGYLPARVVRKESAQNEDDSWFQVMDSKDPADLEAFLAQWPNGRHVVDAEALLAALKVDRDRPSQSLPADRHPLIAERQTLYAVNPTFAFVEPDTESETLSEYGIYGRVEVVGKVENLNWYAVVIRGKGTAYVPGWDLIDTPYR